MELTEEQKRVTDARDCSLLVAAAAGSGKTAVLVQRITDRILEGSVSLDRLLIVTFTKAAAAEMRDRIGKALSERLDKEHDNEILKTQAALVSNAQICTIDSFCMSVVRENFETVGIDPGFILAEEQELELLKEDVLDELMEEEYEKHDDDFLVFMKSFNDYKDDNVAKKMILQVHRFAESSARPEEWLEEVAKSVLLPFEKNKIIEAIIEETEKKVAGIEATCLRCVEICKEDDGPKPYGKAFETDLINIDTLYETIKSNKDFDIIKDAFSVFDSWEGIGRIGKKDTYVSVEKQNKVKAYRSEYKDIIKKLKEDYFFGTLSELDAVNSLTIPVVTTLVRLTKEFKLRFDAVKRDKNAYGFSDIAHFAHQILCVREGDKEMPSDIAREYAKRYDEIMIDEYQDSSELQEYTLKAVSGEFGDAIPNLFMVGDVKQSIYGFRQAVPELFIGKYEDFSDYPEGGTHRKIELSKNFRSRKCVLDSVNVLLSPSMKKELSGIEYDEKAALHFGSNNYLPDTSEYNTELILLDKKTTEEEQEQLEEVLSFYKSLDSSEDELIAESSTDDIQREAFAIALRMKELIKDGFKVRDKKVKDSPESVRCVNYGDFAVLTRKNKDYSDTFTKIFNRLGIPAIAENGSGFFDAVEVTKVLALLRILDNPYQDIPMAAVLHSYFGGFDTDLNEYTGEFDAELLAELKIKYGYFDQEESDKKKRHKLLYEALIDSAQSEEEGVLEKKCRSFIKLYWKLKNMQEMRTVHEIIGLIYDETGYKDYVTGIAGGERRRGNLDILLRLARKYEKSTYTGIHEFLRYIDRLLSDGTDFGEAMTEVSGDVVRITTIHKSKGLEYPVVFLAGMGREFNNMDTRSDYQLDKKYGIGVRYVDFARRKKGKTINKIFMEERTKRKTREEELRLLYVALTRAEEKLILVGTVCNPEKEIKSWRGKEFIEDCFSRSALDKVKSYLDFVGPVIYKNLEGNEGTAVVSNFSGTEEFTAQFDVFLKTFDEKETFDALFGQSHVAEDNQNADILKDVLDEEDIKAEIKAQESYEYPYREIAMQPLRVSVSDLKHIEIEALMQEQKQYEEEPVHLMPDFLTEDDTESGSPVNGAMRGTLYHEVFEKLTYKGDYTDYEKAKASVLSDINGLTDGLFLKKDILNTVAADKITRFVMSGIGQRFVKAAALGTLKREQPFVYGLSNEEYRFYSKSDAETETVMVQGIIDAYIDNGDTLTLVDYKTDRVGKNPDKELTDKYHVQLDLYAKALERLTGKKVTEKIIYSVSCDREILL